MFMVVNYQVYFMARCQLNIPLHAAGVKSEKARPHHVGGTRSPLDSDPEPLEICEAVRSSGTTCPFIVLQGGFLVHLPQFTAVGSPVHQAGDASVIRHRLLLLSPEGCLCM